MYKLTHCSDCSLFIGSGLLLFWGCSFLGRLMLKRLSGTISLNTVPFWLIQPSCSRGPMVLAEFSHLSHVTTPMTNDFWWIQKWSKKAIYRCGSYGTFFSTCLLKENTDWSMTNILEVQMLRYSKIMMGNCCDIWSSLLSSIMSCHQWVIRSPDWPDHFFLTTMLFSSMLPLHALLASPSVSYGQPNFRLCPRSHQHWM